MRLIDATNAVSFLREKCWLAPTEPAEARELSGGVSNLVLYIRRDPAVGADFVVKQAREQLRVPEPWFCGVDRIWREVAVLEYCGRVLDGGGLGRDLSTGTVSVGTPRVLFEDRDNYVYAMTAAPANHVVWKADLLAGRVEPEVANACGRLLGTLHAATWRDPAAADQLGDRRFFEDLRVDPYYRQIARVHADLAGPISRLIDSLGENRLALVHGDFSPKNLLRYDHHLLLVDFEVGHFGDPAFDLGFFLSHLVLKAIRAWPDDARYLELTTIFWQAYRETLRPRVSAAELADLEARAVLNLAGCALARVDGKSRVDYLAEPWQPESVRAICRRLFLSPVGSWPEVLASLVGSGVHNSKSVPRGRF